MKKLIAVVFAISMISLSAKAEQAPADAAANSQQQAHALVGANQQNALGNKFQPIGKVFGETVNQYRANVNTCIPQQGAQGFAPTSAGGYVY